MVRFTLCVFQPSVSDPWSSEDAGWHAIGWCACGCGHPAHVWLHTVQGEGRVSLASLIVSPPHQHLLVVVGFLLLLLLFWGGGYLFVVFLFVCFGGGCVFVFLWVFWGGFLTKVFHYVQNQ